MNQTDLGMYLSDYDDPCPGIRLKGIFWNSLKVSKFNLLNYELRNCWLKKYIGQVELITIIDQHWPYIVSVKHSNYRLILSSCVLDFSSTFWPRSGRLMAQILFHYSMAWPQLCDENRHLLSSPSPISSVRGAPGKQNYYHLIK